MLLRFPPRPPACSVFGGTVPVGRRRKNGVCVAALQLASLRKPKRLVARGDDEREHMFLVKARARERGGGCMMV